MGEFFLDQGFIDHSGERASTRYASYSGASNPIPAAAYTVADEVHDAMAAVTLCNMTTQHIGVVVNDDTPVIPSSHFAQRELALLIEYADTTTQTIFSMSIPGVDTTLVSQANTDEVDIASNAAALALIAALEANCVSRDGNAIEVKRMRIIGRSN